MNINNTRNQIQRFSIGKELNGMETLVSPVCMRAELSSVANEPVNCFKKIGAKKGKLRESAEEKTNL